MGALICAQISACLISSMHISECKLKVGPRSTEFWAEKSAEKVNCFKIQQIRSPFDDS